MKEYYKRILKALEGLKNKFRPEVSKSKIRELTLDLDKELQKAEEEFIRSLILKQQNIAKAKGLTLDDVLVDEMVFAELKNSKVVYATVNTKEMIKNIRKRIVQDANAQMRGSVIAEEDGLLPNTKKTRRDLKTVQTAVIDKTKQQSNIESFKKNKKVEWVEFVNQEDERVDSVCKRYAQESIAMKYSPSDFPEYMVPQTHYNCRCKLKPHYEKA